MTSPRLQWFIDRIGKRIFGRDEESNFLHPSTILDVHHAHGLFGLEHLKVIKYFDTKEEAEQFKNKE